MWLHKLITLSLMIVFGVLSWFAGLTAAIFWTLVLSFISYRWDSRAAAIMALSALSVCPFLIVWDKQAYAEIAAIWAYYFLVVTVIVQIIEVRREGHASNLSKSVSNARARIKIWADFLVLSRKSTAAGKAGQEKAENQSAAAEPFATAPVKPSAEYKEISNTGRVKSIFFKGTKKEFEAFISKDEEAAEINIDAGPAVQRVNRAYRASEAISRKILAIGENILGFFEKSEMAIHRMKKYLFLLIQKRKKVSKKYSIAADSIFIPTPDSIRILPCPKQDVDIIVPFPPKIKASKPFNGPNFIIWGIRHSLLSLGVGSEKILRSATKSFHAFGAATLSILIRISRADKYLNFQKVRYRWSLAWGRVINHNVEKYRKNNECLSAYSDSVFRMTERGAARSRVSVDLLSEKKSFIMPFRHVSSAIFIILIAIFAMSAVELDTTARLRLGLAVIIIISVMLIQRLNRK